MPSTWVTLSHDGTLYEAVVHDDRSVVVYANRGERRDAVTAGRWNGGWIECDQIGTDAERSDTILAALEAALRLELDGGSARRAFTTLT